MNKWTRRAFITTGVLAGGTLVLGIAVRTGNRAGKVADLIAEEGETVLNVWLKIAPDNTITVIVPHAEMGQGVQTSLAMMLADELDADWQQVRTEEAPAHKEYANHALIKGFVAGDKDFPNWLIPTVDGVFLTIGKQMALQITGGSASVRFTGASGMRVAGAAARAVLVQAAAEAWNVPAEEVRAEKSMLYHDASGQKGPFASFAQQAAALSAPVKPQLKDPKQFNLMGTSPPRLDIPAKVDGSAVFGMDVSLPNMKYAAIKASPVFKSKVVKVDDAQARQMPGVQKIIPLESAVAVIADGYWQAKQALDKVAITFEESPNDFVTQEEIYAQFARDLDADIAGEKMEKDVKQGEATEALSQADRQFEATYRLPFLAHAAMEPLNCTVWVQNDRCEVWTGTQNPLGMQKEVADLLDMDQDQVTVYNQLLGGGFGRRSEPDVVRQATQIAREVSYPVKLIWSREEDTRQDVYREATLSRFKAGIDKEGRPVAWTNQYLYKFHPEEASHIPYQIDHQLIQYTTSPTHVPWGNWRSVAHSTHGFFIESFVDELAHFSGKDPYQFRKELLAHQPRFQALLDKVAAQTNWGQPLPEGFGRGIAVHASFGTIVAQVAEVEVSNEGAVKVRRVVCAVDPGIAIHPDGLTAQMESGIVYGLSAALTGEITIDKGAVVQSNFHDYPVLRMPEMPQIETLIINSGEKIGGAGEPSTPVIGPALTNAIYDATGIRIRELPVKNHDLSRANWAKKVLG